MTDHAIIVAWDARDFARFWGNVNIGAKDECWEWTGCAYRGYGQFHIGGRNTGRAFMAHRVAWSMANRTLEIPFHVCHKCDNPPCVNPTHLFLGTDADNVRDMIEKGRNCKGEDMTAALTGNMPRGTDHHNAILDEEKVLRIRSLYVPRHYSYKRLSVQFGVAASTIQAIIERRMWKHI